MEAWPTWKRDGVMLFDPKDGTTTHISMRELIAIDERMTPADRTAVAVKFLEDLYAPYEQPKTTHAA